MKNPIFAKMNCRKFTVILCLLAYTIVFAHSVIPHEHHCFESHDNHLHHFNHCESLNTFLLKQALSDTELTFCLGEILPSEPLAFNKDAASVKVEFDFSDKFSLADLPLGRVLSLRAPPAV